MRENQPLETPLFSVLAETRQGGHEGLCFQNAGKNRFKKRDSIKNSMSFLGIGAGKMELSLGNTNFYPGDTITGNAKLTINSPIKARGVIVAFWGERQERTYVNGKPATRTQVFCKVEKNLDGEKEYVKTA